MLFIFNKIIDNPILLECIQQDDAIILIEDGVYNLAKPGFIEQINSEQCYGLSADIIARQINITDKITLANYHDFVELCAQHEKICQL